jgi:hypothetical protein
METREEQLKAFLEENKNLFWYTNKANLNELSDEAIVEFVLNYGNYKAVKDLLGIMGINRVAEVFYNSVAPGRRVNYFQPVIHFFDLYFKRHASGDFKQRAVGAASFGQKIQ